MFRILSFVSAIQLSQIKCAFLFRLCMCVCVRCTSATFTTDSLVGVSSESISPQTLTSLDNDDGMLFCVHYNNSMPHKTSSSKFFLLFFFTHDLFVLVHSPEILIIPNIEALTLKSFGCRHCSVPDKNAKKITRTLEH